MGKKHRRESYNPGPWLVRRLMIFWVVLMGVISPCFNAPAPIDHMTECERGVYTKCVINIGSSKVFQDKCQPDELLQCLRNAFQEEICTVKDAETVPTIKRLVAYVRRKFEKDPHFCKDQRKFGLFVERIQDSLTVQGEGVEFTDPQNYDQYSGSGAHGKIPDDTESDGEDEDNEDDDVINKNDVNKKKDKPSNKKNDKKDNSVRKDSKFWKQTSELILKGKNGRRVQGRIVYFDDHERRKKKKEKEKIENAWNKLKTRYQRWYESSKYYKAK